MTNFGFYWSYSTAANQTSQFDNFRVTVTQPSITVSGGPLNFSNTGVGAASAAQSYNVSGSNLTANLVVTAPSTDFQVSTSSNSGFGSSVSLTPSSGTVASTPIFVRFTPQSEGAKSGNVTNASTGATTQNVAVSGTGVSVLNVTNDPTVTEGNSGTTLATFNVTLTPASSQTVTVHYATQDNTATTADNDYVAIPDTLLTFNPGETSKNIDVSVNGDTKIEPNEQFFFNISFPSNANISDNQGVGTITNDDAETDVSVSGGNLSITDGNGGTSNDTLNISLNGANVRINDPNNTLSAGAGATQVDPNTVDVPLASISGQIQVNTLGGNDTLTLNLAGGNFFPAGGIAYAGGTQTSTPGDKLVITGGSQGTVTYNYTNANDGSVVMSNFCVSALELALAERSAEDEHPTAAMASAVIAMTTFMSLPDIDCGKNARGGAIAPPTAAMIEARAALCQGSRGDPGREARR